MEPENGPWKRRFLLETIISRFHVCFRGCNLHVNPMYVQGPFVGPFPAYPPRFHGTWVQASRSLVAPQTFPFPVDAASMGRTVNIPSSHGWVMGLVGFQPNVWNQKYVSQFFVSSPQISGESKNYKYYNYNIWNHLLSMLSMLTKSPAAGVGLERDDERPMESELLGWDWKPQNPIWTIR